MKLTLSDFVDELGCNMGLGQNDTPFHSPSTLIELKQSLFPFPTKIFIS
jgi:hypothetical protein